jgi:protein CpxP
MKRWIKRTLVGLFGASLLVGGLSACSHHRFGTHAWPIGEADATAFRERLIDKATRELSLDDAQRARLVALADAIRAQRAALLATSGGDTRAELHALIAGAQFDRAKAQSILDAKSAAVRDQAPLVITALGDFYDSLNVEQQRKLRDFLARHRGHGRHS